MAKSLERILSGKQFENDWEYDQAKREHRKEERRKRDDRRGRKDRWQTTE